MEAARTLPFHSTRSHGDEVIIDGLRVADEALLRLVREREDAGGNPDVVVRDALEIGARVIHREQTGSEAEVVKAEFDGLKSSITEHTKRLADRMDEKIGEVFDSEEGEFARLVAKHFGEDSAGALPHRMKALMAEASSALRDDLRKQLASESDDNPLAKFHRMQMALAEASDKRHASDMRAMTEKMEALRVELEKLRGENEKAVALAAEADRGTAKGRPYEDAVCEALEAIACARGDDAEAVGDMRGEGGRKGDVVVGVEGATGVARAHIVFEAKNSRMSRPEALRYLDEARLTRNADYAVLVVPSEDKLPAKTVQLREFNGDKMFVVFDPEDGSRTALEVAYALARARVLMNRSENAGIDCDAIRAETERALSALGALTQVKRQLSNAKTDIDKAQDIVETMAANVHGHLGQIDVLLAAAGDDADAAE